MRQEIQDAYSTLVEEARTKRIYRANMGAGKRTFDELHDPEVEFADLPVFMHSLHPQDVEKLLSSMPEDFSAVKLPYQRCAFISDVPPEFDPLGVGRYYVIVAEEEDDGILLFGFLKDDRIKHWARQVWQCFVRDGQWEFSFQPGTVDADFARRYVIGTQSRVLLVLAICFRMCNDGGSATTLSGGSETSRADARRIKLGLPAVPRIRVLDFDKPAIVAQSSGRGGWTQPPHYRHGYWKETKTGRKTWVAPYAVGGGGAPPPWYEVR